MSKPKSSDAETIAPVVGTSAPASGTQNPLRVTVQIAVGDNVDGEANMARAAHADVAPPDPAIVDDPEAPELPAPTPTKE